MDHLDQRDLQRYADGELGRRRSRKVEEHLEACSECAAALEEIRGVGGLLRLMADEVGERAEGLEGLADAVLEGIERERPLPLGERLRAWLSEFARYQKKIWVPSLAAAGAAAAALLFVLNVQGPPDAQDPTGRAGLRPGSNVLSVSFGREVDGTLFQLEGKDGSTTAVIWVDEGEAVPEVKRT